MLFTRTRTHTHTHTHTHMHTSSIQCPRASEAAGKRIDKTLNILDLKGFSISELVGEVLSNILCDVCGVSLISTFSLLLLLFEYMRTRAWSYPDCNHMDLFCEHSPLACTVFILYVHLCNVYVHCVCVCVHRRILWWKFSPMAHKLCSLRYIHVCAQIILLQEALSLFY